MEIKLPATSTLENGYNIAVMNYNLYGNSDVSIIANHSLLDGLKNKFCRLNMSFRLIASNSVTNQWVSVGGSNVNVKNFNQENTTNVDSTNPHTIEKTIDQSNDNDIFIFPNNNYSKKNDKNKYYHSVNDPGYKVIVNRDSLYPGFRFTVSNYSASIQPSNGSTEYNSNLDVKCSNDVRINNNANMGVTVGPWWVHTSNTHGKSGGYSNAPCATFMFDGANWWNVRS